jgi:hypothetical protein
MRFSVGTLAACLLSAATAAPAHALEPWRTQDAILEGVFGGLVALDVAQTCGSIARGALERNPLLSRRPTCGLVASVSAATVFGHALVARLLPVRYREAWQGVFVAVELGNMADQMLSFGVRF